MSIRVVVCGGLGMDAVGYGRGTDGARAGRDLVGFLITHDASLVLLRLRILRFRGRYFGEGHRRFVSTMPFKYGILKY